MAFDNDSVPGLFGFAAQGKRVVADTAGFFGWSAGRATNFILSFSPPAGALTVRTPLSIALSYAGSSVNISYNPDFPRLERQLPTGTLITVTTSSALYDAASISFVIAPNEVVSRVLSLEFLQAPVARIIRKTYR